MQEKENRKNHKKISNLFFHINEASASCKLCSSQFSLLKSQLSNLTLHLQRKHEIELNEYLNISQEKKKCYKKIQNI